jgi:RNA polymerase sigma-70 factor (ECF subfamily)
MCVQLNQDEPAGEIPPPLRRRLFADVHAMRSSPGVEEPLDAWFKREVLIHEGALMRFISRVWSRHDEVADIRQETYARVYEAARVLRPQAPKAFLFATARHLMVDRIRRERIVSIKAGGENEFLNFLVDEISPERRVGVHQDLARLAWAFDRLPAKCREVVWLRRVKELSQKEVACRLGLMEKTIEKHLRTGARQLAHYMRDGAIVPRSSCGDVDEAQHHELGSQRRY